MGVENVAYVAWEMLMWLVNLANVARKMLMEVEIVLVGVEKVQKGALWASFGSYSWGRGKYSVNLQV